MIRDYFILKLFLLQTAFTLHQKGNLQSFKSVMRGLQLPDVYRLRSAWKVLRQKFPLHLRYLLLLNLYFISYFIIIFLTEFSPT